MEQEALPTTPEEAAILVALRNDWAGFQIARIEFFDGRTVGSLTPAELRGLRRLLGLKSPEQDQEQ